MPKPLPTAPSHFSDAAGSTDISGDSASTTSEDDGTEEPTPNDADDAYAMASLSIVGIVAVGMLLGSAMSYRARKSREAAGEVDPNAQDHGEFEMAPGMDESSNGQNSLYPACGNSEENFEASKRRDPEEVEEI